MAALVERLDRVISVRTFAITFTCFFLLMAAVIVTAGLLGSPPDNYIEKTVPLSGEKIVPVTSGDLNQLDITQPPPKVAAVTEAGKPQSRDIQESLPELTENSPDGKLPIIGKNGATPFKSYAAAFTPDPTAKALVSFVMVDYGLSQKNSSLALSQLPDGVSFALDAYTRAAQKWTSDARKLNHEIWLSLPLQQKDYPQVDTGPKTILAALAGPEAIKRTPSTLGTATGYSGIVAGNADAFLKSQSALQAVLNAIANRGLGIIESDPADKTLAPLAAQTKAPFAQANIWIDQINSDKDLQAKLITIESTAVKNKKLVVFFRPYPVAIKAISAWAVEARNRGIQLAPLTAIVAK